MTVRNFYATIENDRGRAFVATGPQGKDEGFEIRIQQRDRGDIVKAATVRGWARPDGKLELRVFDATGTLVHSFTTER